MPVQTSRFDAGDLPPIDRQLAPGLRRAFPLAEGGEDLFRPVLEALSLAQGTRADRTTMSAAGGPVR